MYFFGSFTLHLLIEFLVEYIGWETWVSLPFQIEKFPPTCPNLPSDSQDHRVISWLSMFSFLWVKNTGELLAEFPVFRLHVC
jgi:hypothetical protein